MPLTERLVHFFALRPHQASRSKRFQEDHNFSFREALFGLEKGWNQEHHAKETKELFAYTKIRDIYRSADSTTLLIGRGSTRRTAPMLDNATQFDEAEHVEIAEGKMQSWSTHVVINHKPELNGTHSVVIEHVHFLSRTDIQNFLGHLLCRRIECQREQDGYHIYFRPEMTSKTTYPLAEFLATPGIPTELQVVISDGRLDSSVDEVFDVSYSKTTDTNMLRGTFQKIMIGAMGRGAERVRIRSTQDGQSFQGDFQDLSRDIQELRLTRTASITFSPPLEQHHTSIDSAVRARMIELLEE